MFNRNSCKRYTYISNWILTCPYLIEQFNYLVIVILFSRNKFNDIDLHNNQSHITHKAQIFVPSARFKELGNKHNQK